MIISNMTTRGGLDLFWLTSLKSFARKTVNSYKYIANRIFIPAGLVTNAATLKKTNKPFISSAMMIYKMLW